MLGVKALKFTKVMVVGLGIDCAIQIIILAVTTAFWKNLGVYTVRAGAYNEAAVLHGLPANTHTAQYGISFGATALALLGVSVPGWYIIKRFPPGRPACETKDFDKKLLKLWLGCAIVSTAFSITAIGISTQWFNESPNGGPQSTRSSQWVPEQWFYTIEHLVGGGNWGRNLDMQAMLNGTWRWNFIAMALLTVLVIFCIFHILTKISEDQQPTAPVYVRTRRPGEVWQDVEVQMVNEHNSKTS